MIYFISSVVVELTHQMTEKEKKILAQNELTMSTGLRFMIYYCILFTSHSYGA